MRDICLGEGLTFVMERFQIAHARKNILSKRADVMCANKRGKAIHSQVAVDDLSEQNLEWTKLRARPVCTC